MPQFHTQIKSVCIRLYVKSSFLRFYELISDCLTEDRLKCKKKIVSAKVSFGMVRVGI